MLEECLQRKLAAGDACCEENMAEPGCKHTQQVEGDVLEECLPGTAG